MEARKNRISQVVSEYSDQEIATAYKEIVDWKNSGVLADEPCMLKKIERAIREMIGSMSVDYRLAEEAVLVEAGRRFYNMVE